MTQRLFFVNNPTIQPRTVELAGGYTDALSDAPVRGAMTLHPFDVRVLRSEP